MIDNIWKQFISHENELNKSETLNFLNDFLLQYSEKYAHLSGDFLMEGLMPGKVFDSIFIMLDESKNGRLDKHEILGYLIKLHSGGSGRP